MPRFRPRSTAYAAGDATKSRISTCVLVDYDIFLKRGERLEREGFLSTPFGSVSTRDGG